jgi:hypothetical protein
MADDRDYGWASGANDSPILASSQNNSVRALSCLDLNI